MATPRRAFCAADGGQPGEFLRQEPSARGAALGGAGAAVANDVSALVWNPAGLARLVKPEVSATHVVLFEDTSYDFIAAAMPPKSWGAFGLAFIRQSTGGFERRASPNDPGVAFDISNQALIFGGARSFGPVDAGLTIKSVKESVDTASASGTGADAGVNWKTPVEGLRVALAARNLLQPTITLVSVPQKYPRVIDFSPMYQRKLSRDWIGMATLSLAKATAESLSPAGGVELRYRALAALRLGYQKKGFSSGVGVRVGNSSFDYAILNHALGMSHLITFTQRFGHTKEELEETIRRGISELTRTEGARLAKAYVQRADRELADNRVSEALHDLESASLLDPTNEEIHQRIQKVGEKWESQLRRQLVDRTTQLAQREETAGNALAARQYWRSVLELDPADQRAKDRVAAIDAQLSQGDVARLDAARKAREDADAGQVLSAAQALAERGQLRQALTEVQKASARIPESDRLRQAVPEYMEKLKAFVAGKTAEGEKLAAAHDFTGALRAVEPALREAPSDPALAQKVASWRGQLSRTASPDDRKRAEQLYYQAVEQYLKGDFKAAGALTQQVLALDPGSEPAIALKEKVDAALRYSK